MRKVIVSLNVTLDGFVAGPDCELDWHFKYWTDDMAQTAAEQLSAADTIVLGRITYQAMALYWPFQPLNLSFARQDIAYADMMNHYKKVVFSKTLTRLGWQNAKLATGNLRKEISRLKEEEGKNIIVFGSSSIVSAMIQSDLIDEYQLWVHPVWLGTGKPLFRNAKDKSKLSLLHQHEFLSGVTLFYYKPVKKHLIRNKLSF
jgi:dihydrofolate reductase